MAMNIFKAGLTHFYTNIYFSKVDIIYIQERTNNDWDQMKVFFPQLFSHYFLIFQVSTSVI